MAERGLVGSSPGVASGYEMEDPEASRVIDLNALMTQLYPDPKLSQNKTLSRQTMKRGPTLFRTGFRRFIQHHRWDRIKCWRNCIACNSKFVAKRKVRKMEAIAVQERDVWVDISEGGDRNDDSASQRLPQTWIDVVSSGGTTAGIFSEISVLQTGHISSNNGNSEFHASEGEMGKNEDEMSRETRDELCQSCKATWMGSTGRHDPDGNSATVIEERVNVPGDTRRRAESTEANDDSAAQYTGPVRSVGNIPTLDEAIRRQERTGDDADDNEGEQVSEALWKTASAWIVSWLVFLVQIFLIELVAIPGAVISIIFGILIVEQRFIIKFLELSFTLIALGVHAYTTFIMDLPTIITGFVLVLAEFLSDFPRRRGRMIRRLPFMIGYLTGSLIFDIEVLALSLLRASLRVFELFPLEIDRGVLEVLLQTFDTLTFIPLLHIAGLILATLEFSPRPLCTLTVNFFKTFWRRFVQFVKLGIHKMYEVIKAGVPVLMALPYIAVSVYEIFVDIIYFLRKCTFPNSHGSLHELWPLTCRVQDDVWNYWSGLFTGWMSCIYHKSGPHSIQ